MPGPKPVALFSLAQASKPGARERDRFLSPLASHCAYSVVKDQRRRPRAAPDEAYASLSYNVYAHKI